MKVYNVLFWVALIISVIAALTALFLPLWIFVLWLLVPLGIIAGFFVDLKENNVFYLVLIVLFIVSGVELASVSSSIFIIGTGISTFVEGLLLFIPAAFFTASLRYLLNFSKGR